MIYISMQMYSRSSGRKNETGLFWPFSPDGPGLQIDITYVPSLIEPIEHKREYIEYTNETHHAI